MLFENIKTLFQEEGFSVNTNTAVNEEKIKEIYQNQPDVILLDLNIKNSDGIELCYELKSNSNLSSFIVLFTDHKEEYIQLEAFKAGADDYIVRPISSMVLLKKINALLKRKPHKPEGKKNTLKSLSDNLLKIDKESYLIHYNNEKIILPKKQFEILFLFANSPQKVFSREEIFTEVWDDKNCANSRIIDVHIRKIRQKLGDKIINTVKGVGYQLAIK